MNSEKEVAFSTLVDKDSGREVASLWRSDLIDLIADKENHMKLVGVCSGVLTDEDGPSESPMHERVFRAIERITSERDSMGIALKRLCKARGMQADTGDPIPSDLWSSARLVLEECYQP